MTDIFTANTVESRVWIDDHLLQDEGIAVLLNSEEPALPAMRNISVSVPGRHGAYDFGAYLEPREFTLNVVFPRQSYADLKYQIRQFVRKFTDEYGRPKTVRLRFGDEVDKYYNVRLTESIPVERAAERGYLALGLTAFDPYAYASANAYDPEEDYEYNSGYEYDTGLMYDNPQSFRWVYPKHYSGINNYSDYTTDFIIEIDGSVKNPSITNLNNGIKLTLPDITNGKLTINSKDYTVIKNGVSTLLGTNGEFFRIQPGEVGFLFEGVNPNATVTYRWYHKFM